MGRKKVNDKPIETNNLRFIGGKIKPIQARIVELEAELKPLQEQLNRLKKGAKTAAESVWDECVTRTANEWKSSHGDEELSIEWVDERYTLIPAEVFTFLEEQERYSRKDDTPRDLMGFYDEVSVAIEGEDE